MNLCGINPQSNNASSFPAYSVQFGKCLQRLIKKMNDIGRDDLVERLVGIVKVENVGILKGGVSVIQAFPPGPLQHLLGKVSRYDMSADGSDVPGEQARPTCTFQHVVFIFDSDYFFFRVRKYFPIAMMAKKAKAIMT